MVQNDTKMDVGTLLVKERKIQHVHWPKKLSQIWYNYHFESVEEGKELFSNMLRKTTTK